MESRSLFTLSERVCEEVPQTKCTVVPREECREETQDVCKEVEREDCHTKPKCRKTQKRRRAFP